MANPMKCWWCEHFNPTVIGTNQGECRAVAPSGLSSNLIPALVPDKSGIFPLIYEGTTEFCGDFKPAINVVPEPTPV